MRYAVGSDHAGLALKNALAAYLKERGADVEDFGTDSAASVDYPDYAQAVSRAVAEGRFERGLLVCGTGLGMMIAANKVPSIRAVCVSDAFSAAMAVQHNNAQILCLGQRVVGEGLARSIVDAFDGASFEGGRHQRRVNKIHLPEQGDG